MSKAEKQSVCCFKLRSSVRRAQEKQILAEDGKPHKSYDGDDDDDDESSFEERARGDYVERSMLGTQDEYLWILLGGTE